MDGKFGDRMKAQAAKRQQKREEKDAPSSPAGIETRVAVLIWGLGLEFIGQQTALERFGAAASSIILHWWVGGFWIFSCRDQALVPLQKVSDDLGGYGTCTVEMSRTSSWLFGSFSGQLARLEQPWGACAGGRCRK